jgi:hypothetical protein
MTITYTWNIVQLDCYPEYAGETDVVFTSNWTLDGTDGDYLGSVYGTQELNYVAGTPFTPYDQLTLEQVIGWTKNAMGAEKVVFYESVVASQIEIKINSPVVSPPLPWAN